MCLSRNSLWFVFLQTGVMGVFVGDYFQQQINADLTYVGFSQTRLNYLCDNEHVNMSLGF